jgi:hypothetical protein
MNIFGIVMMMFWMSVGFFGIAAQTLSNAPFANPADAFKSAGVMQRPERASADKAVANPGAAEDKSENLSSAISPRVEPGETPLFMLMTDNDSPTEGQEVNLSFHAMQDYDAYLFGSCMRLVPGGDGRYDGTVPPQYFFPKIGDTGVVRNIYRGQSFRNVFSMKFSGGMPSGEYWTTCVFYDQSGTLVQQVSNSTFYEMTSSYGRITWSIDSVSVKETRDGLMLHAVGNFPARSPLYAMVGKSSGPRGSVHKVQSKNGTDLFVPLRDLQGYAIREFKMDLNVLDQKHFREAFGYVNAYTMKITK